MKRVRMEVPKNASLALSQFPRQTRDLAGVFCFIYNT